MNELLLDAAPEPEPAAAAYPAEHGRFDRLGGLFARTNTASIFAVIHEISLECERAGQRYWSFAQYERVFEAATNAGRASEFILVPLVRLRRRYLAARAAHLSPWQFAESERRFRESADDAAARSAAIDRDMAAKSKANAYRAMVAEAETKERARREARANVEAQMPSQKSARVASRPAQRAAKPLFGEREPIEPEQVYIPPDIF